MLVFTFTSVTPARPVSYRPPHPQVVDHEEAVRLRDAAVPHGLAAGDEVVAVHVEVGEDPRVGIERVRHLQVERVTQVNLPGGGVAAADEAAVVPEDGAGASHPDRLHLRFPRRGEVELDEVLLHAAHEDAAVAAVEEDTVHVRHVVGRVREDGDAASDLRSQRSVGQGEDPLVRGQDVADLNIFEVRFIR